MKATGQNGQTPLLVARGLRHRFGATEALAGVDLELREREILGVVGAGGAGKTTLIGALAGLFPADEGETLYRGYRLRLRSRSDAVRIGLALVEQEPHLVPDLDVYDNVALPLLGRLTRAEPPDLRRRVHSLLESLGQGDAPALGTRAADLTRVQTWLVAMVRALVARAKFYLFDSPFGDLSRRDADSLAGLMGRLRMAGTGLIVTARRLDDLLPLVDRVLVLDAGVGVLTASARTEEGQAALRNATRPPRPALPAVSQARRSYRLEVSGLEAAGVHDVSFAVAAGEVAALHGVRGAGRSPLLRAIAGVGPRLHGSVKVDTTVLPPENSWAALRAGLSFFGPESRSLLPDASGLDNLALLSGPSTAASWPLERLRETLGLSARDLAGPLGVQAMGIRRRILLAGTLLAGQAMVVAHDPARGLDPGERDAVLAALRAAAARGAAVLVACSDAAEVDGVADRVLPLRGGRLVGEASRPLLDPELIDALAMPPAAAERGAAMLAALTRENGGAAFWALLRDDHVLCLGSAVAERDADPGLPPARAVRLDGTRIREALACRDPERFVVEPDGRRRTLLTPLGDRRGRTMGWVGLTLGPSHAAPPPAAAVGFRVESLAASL